MTEIGASSIAGPRPQNEDGFLTIDLTSHSDRLGGLRALLVVADGMGGHANGELASRSAIEASQSYAQNLLARVLSGQEPELEAYHLLWDMIGAANAAVLRVSREQGAGGMGSTIVAALVGQDRAWVAHVGDSRAYHLSPNEIKRVTTDHSLVGRLVAQGVITESEAIQHPQRNVVERALGFEGALPDFGKVWLGPADALVLASDGLFTALPPEQILATAASGETVADAAGRLTTAAAEAGTDDNTTVAMWAGDWPGFRAAYGAAGVEATTMAAASQPTLEAFIATPERPSAAKQNRRAWYITGAVLAAGLLVILGLVFTATRDGAGGGGNSASSVGSTTTDSTAERVDRIDVQVAEDGGWIRLEDSKSAKIVGTLGGWIEVEFWRAEGAMKWYRISVNSLTQDDFLVGTVEGLIGHEYVFISDEVLMFKSGN